MTDRLQMKWEYTSVRNTTALNDPILDVYGEVGWELCSIVFLEDSQEFFYTFKRPAASMYSGG